MAGRVREACGTPVLTFAEGAAPEIVEDGVTGYICEDDDAMGSRCAEVVTSSSSRPG